MINALSIMAAAAHWAAVFAFGFVGWLAFWAAAGAVALGAFAVRAARGESETK